jgi:hypothetical protein
MNFENIRRIKNYGFTGFLPVSDLIEDQSIIPASKGVYMILHLTYKAPKFLPIGSGGIFKGEDPNVSVHILSENWVDGAKVLYIGQAGGGNNNSSTLKSRINKLLNFGQGKNVSHAGGRYIWQIKDSRNLVVCWKTLPYDEPREVKKNLLINFKATYNKRPFANLVDQ